MAKNGNHSTTASALLGSLVADATGAPEPAHTAGLSRMWEAGVVIVHVKNLYYEWLRTVEQVRRFRTACADLVVPEGLRL